MVEQVGFIENVEEAREADRATDAGEGLVGKMLGKVIVATAASNGTDVFVFGQDKLENGTSVVVETADDLKVGFDLKLGVWRGEGL